MNANGATAIRRDDPARRHLHDYFLVDPATGEDIVGLATHEAALAYAVRHLRGRLAVLDVVHPEGCACPDAPARDPDGVGADPEAER